MLFNVMVAQGLYAEAENMGREVLQWIQSNELFDNDDLDALGTKRLLIKVLCRQGKIRRSKRAIWRDFGPR